MRSDAYIRVTCDGEDCDSEEEIELTALAGGGWDERNVDRQLRHWGWKIDGDQDICPDCQEEDE